MTLILLSMHILSFFLTSSCPQTLKKCLFIGEFARKFSWKCSVLLYSSSFSLCSSHLTTRESSKRLSYCRSHFKMSSSSPWWHHAMDHSFNEITNFVHDCNKIDINIKVSWCLSALLTKSSPHWEGKTHLVFSEVSKCCLCVDTDILSTFTMVQEPLKPHYRQGFREILFFFFHQITFLSFALHLQASTSVKPLSIKIWILFSTEYTCTARRQIKSKRSLMGFRYAVSFYHLTSIKPVETKEDIPLL